MKLTSFYVNAADWNAFDRVTLTFESRVICDLWAESVGKAITTRDIWQVSLICHQGDPPVSSPNNIGGSLHVPVVLKSADYFRLTWGERKFMLNQLLHNTCLRLATTLGAEPARFSTCAARVAALGYQRVWDLPRKRSRSGKNHAYLRCMQDIDCFRLWLIGCTRDGESTHQLVASTLPDSLIFSRFLGTLKWIGDSHVEVLDRNRGLLGRFEIRHAIPSPLMRTPPGV